MFKFFGLIVLVFFNSIAIAEPMSGDAELGFVNTSGNSDTETINARLELAKPTGDWVHKAKMAYLKSESEDTTTAKKYNLNWQSDLSLDERSTFFVIGSYEDDRFSGFDYQASVGVGYGYKVIHGDIHNLTLEIGPGYRVSAIEDGDDEEEYTIRLAELYHWKLSETADFNQHLIVEGGDENTISRLGLSVKSALTGALALKAGMELKHTDEVPDGNKNTDRETYVSVIYSF